MGSQGSVRDDGREVFTAWQGQEVFIAWRSQEVPAAWLVWSSDSWWNKKL